MVEILDLGCPDWGSGSAEIAGSRSLQMKQAGRLHVSVAGAMYGVCASFHVWLWSASNTALFNNGFVNSLGTHPIFRGRYELLVLVVWDFWSRF